MRSNRSTVGWASVGLVVALVIALDLLRNPVQAMSIEVMGAEDPEHIGLVTQMTVKVRNNGRGVSRPIFTVLSSFPFPVRWQPVSGPETLPPGATATYSIKSPADGAIPTGDEAVVRANDIHSHMFAASRPVRMLLENAPALVNAAFREWVFDGATGQPTPLGWTAEGLRSPIGANLRITRRAVAGRQAVAFVIDGRAPEWEGIRIDQDISDAKRISRLLADGFAIAVYPTFGSTPGYGPLSAGEPGNVFGIQVYSGAHWLWILFSDRNAGWNVQPGAAVLSLYAPLGQWSSHRIDLGAAYRRLGWPEPDELVFSLLVGQTGGTRNAPPPAFGAVTLGAPRPSPISGHPLPVK